MFTTGIKIQLPCAYNWHLGAKCVVASPDYRLAPEHPYPAAVEDSFETLQWVFEKGKSLLGVDPTRLAIGGSSA